MWFEGTAHIADALETQDQPGDTAQAAAYLADIAYAQVNGPNADGLGIMASSQDALADCGGGYVYASLHTGTTAWYILAGKGIDPRPGHPSPPSGTEPPSPPGSRLPRCARRPGISA